MEEMACFQRLVFSCCCSSCPSGIFSFAAPRPGTSSMSLSKEPISPRESSCWLKSSSVIFPSASLSCWASSCSGSMADRTFSINAARSPMPSIRERKASGLKVSRSAGFSPVPMKMTGTFASAHAVRAPPAFAVLSIRVMMTPERSRASWNVWACCFAVCPMSAGITRMVSVGFTVLSMVLISFTRSSSRASRPAVSMRMRLYFFRSGLKDS